MEVTSDVLGSRLGVIRSARTRLVRICSQFVITVTLCFKFGLASPLRLEDSLGSLPFTLVAEIAISLAIHFACQVICLPGEVVGCKCLSLIFLLLIHNLCSLMPTQIGRIKFRDVILMDNLPRGQSIQSEKVLPLQIVQGIFCQRPSLIHFGKDVAQA